MAAVRSSTETSPNAREGSTVVIPGAGRRLAMLLACLFVTMIGFGITRHPMSNPAKLLRPTALRVHHPTHALAQAANRRAATSPP